MEIGNFKSVKGDDHVQWLIKIGVPKEDALKMKGTHWSLSIDKVDDKWVINEKCKEIPSLNHLDSYTANTVKDVPVHPLFGIKTKVSFNQTSKDSFQGTAETDKLGVIEWTEKFTEAGFTVNTVHKKTGATLTEFWEREVQETGWYKFVKGENMVNYMVAQGIPKEMASSAGDAYLQWKKQGDTYILTEVWGGVENVFRWKLDEESDYEWPGMPNLARKIVTIQTGPGKYKAVMKGNQGQHEEWSWQFTQDGLIYNGVDKKSGECCKCIYERFTNFNGKYRVVLTDGYKEFGPAVGMTPELVSKLIAEQGIMTINEKDGYVHFTFESQIMPMNSSFKWNEEYLLEVPGVPGSTKNIDTKHGDTILNVSVADSYTTRTTAKFTENFVIQTTNIVGTDISAKIIFERL